MLATHTRTTSARPQPTDIASAAVLEDRSQPPLEAAVAPAALPSATVLQFPLDRVRPPAGHSAAKLRAGQLTAAVTRLQGAVAAYSAAVNAQRAAVEKFAVSTADMGRVAGEISTNNQAIQTDIARILSKARAMQRATIAAE